RPSARRRPRRARAHRPRACRHVAARGRHRRRRAVHRRAAVDDEGVHQATRLSRGMQKQAPSLGRILTMVLFALSCFGLLLFLWLSFGGSIPLEPQKYRIKVAFPEATQLGLEADVRVAGVSVGKVVGKELDPKGGNRTLATL